MKSDINNNVNNASNGKNYFIKKRKVSEIIKDKENGKLIPVSSNNNKYNNNNPNDINNNINVNNNDNLMSNSFNSSKSQYNNIKSESNNDRSSEVKIKERRTKKKYKLFCCF